jgi:hypothetical protein
MKKLAILSMMFLFAASVVMGQAQKKDHSALKKLGGTMVSEKAKGSFAVDFPNVQNVQWSRVGTFDEVSFTKDGNKVKGFYDSAGNLVGTTQTKAFADLPAKGQQEIKAKYKDYTIGPILFYDDNEPNQTDMILWNKQFDSPDSYFVELSKGTSTIIVQVDMTGKTSEFTKLK